LRRCNFLRVAFSTIMPSGKYKGMVWEASEAPCRSTGWSAGHSLAG
jgi:hypothetical protein